MPLLDQYESMATIYFKHRSSWAEAQAHDRPGAQTYEGPGARAHVYETERGLVKNPHPQLGHFLVAR